VWPVAATGLRCTVAPGEMWLLLLLLLLWLQQPLCLLLLHEQHQPCQ